MEWLRVQSDVFPVSDNDGMIVTPMLTTSIRCVYNWSILSERVLEGDCNVCAGIR